jgi:hypothetical protein
MEDLLKAVDEFRSISNPQVADLSKILTHFAINIFASNNKLSRLEEKIDKMDSLTFSNSEKYFVLEKNVDAFMSRCSNLEEQINEIHQLKFENDLILHGFRFMPNLQQIVNNLANLCNFSTQDVNFTFQVVNQNNNYRIVIGFKDKFPKINITRHIRLNGNIFIQQLLDRPLKEENDNVAIRISNRLTAFNINIQSRLNDLKKRNLISCYRFRNQLFQLNKLGASQDDWIDVGHEAILADIENKPQ